MVVQADGEIMEGGEDLAPRAFRGNARDVRDDEVLRAEALGCNNLLLDLAYFPACELGFGTEQDRADPSFAFAAALGHPLQIIARHVDRPISVLKPSLVRRDHDVAGDVLVDVQHATHPLAHSSDDEVVMLPEYS